MAITDIFRKKPKRGKTDNEVPKREIVVRPIDVGFEIRPEPEKKDANPVYREVFRRMNGYIQHNPTVLVRFSEKDIPWPSNPEQVKIGENMLALENLMAQFSPMPDEISKAVEDFNKTLAQKRNAIDNFPSQYKVIINLFGRYSRKRFEEIRENIKGHEEAHLAHGVYNNKGGNQT